MSIKYSKRIVIKQKIFKEDDILRIAKLIHEQFREGDYEEKYEILFDDQSSIIGKNSIDVFKSDEFQRRQCEQLRFTYISKELDNEIEVKLYNSLLTSIESSVEIRSTDRDWYNSICNQILTIINEVEKQKLNMTWKVKYIASIIIGVTEGILLSCSLDRIFPGALSSSQLAVISSFFCAIFWLINSYFLELINKAYPNVEFSFGPIYLNKSQKIRKSIGVLVPFLIDLVFFGLGFLG